MMKLFLFLLVTTIAQGGQTLVENKIVHVQKEIALPFEAFVSNIDKRLGKHVAAAYEEQVRDPLKSHEVEKTISAQSGSSGLMTFAVYDHGSLLTIKKGHPFKAKQYVIGNPLIAATMTELDIRAALYAPLRILIYENASGHTTVEYDLPSSQFGIFKNSKIDQISKSLDGKLEKLISDADSPL
jgi:uncharacterized protein (DUF302 family)